MRYVVKQTAFTCAACMAANVMAIVVPRVLVVRILMFLLQVLSCTAWFDGRESWDKSEREAVLWSVE